MDVNVERTGRALQPGWTVGIALSTGTYGSPALIGDVKAVDERGILITGVEWVGEWGGRGYIAHGDTLVLWKNVQAIQVDRDPPAHDEWDLPNHQGVIWKVFREKILDPQGKADGRTRR